MTHLANLKRFIFDGLLLEDSFDRLEKEGVSVRSGKKEDSVDRVVDADFSPKLIHNAKKMGSVYVLFFCLENAVRELITERLSERHGLNWWDECVPQKIRDSVQKLKDKEEENKYHTSRSSSHIGYTMFGNLGQIIIGRWDDFSDLFPNQAWINSRFNDLEMSRNIIMHTGVLPEMEIDRIESITRDWIRQVG